MNEQINISEAESALIGALVTDGRAFDAVRDLVTPAAFGVETHRQIAEAIWALHGERKPVDPVTVRGTLAAKQQLTDAVAGDFATALSGDYAGWNARAYAELLRDEVRERRMLTIAEEFRNRKGTLAERVNRALRALGELAGDGRKGVSVGDALAGELERWKRERENPDAPPLVYKTGFPWLDRVAGGLGIGDLSVFAARPGVGKSAFAIALASNLAERVPVGVFWLEDSAGDFVRRMIARRCAVRATTLRSGRTISDDDWRDIEADRAGLRKLPIWVDDTHGLTATEIAIRMRGMAREHGVRVFIADHLGEMRIEREDRWGDRHDLAVGRAAKIFRDTAKELGAAPVLMAQMNRSVESRAGGMARLSDINNSGEIEQAARLVAFCSRPTRDAFHLQISKNTGGEADVTVELAWIGDFMTVESC